MHFYVSVTFIYTLMFECFFSFFCFFFFFNSQLDSMFARMYEAPPNVVGPAVAMNRSGVSSMELLQAPKPSPVELAKLFRGDMELYRAAVAKLVVDPDELVALQAESRLKARKVDSGSEDEAGWRTFRIGRKSARKALADARRAKELARLGGDTTPAGSAYAKGRAVSDGKAVEKILDAADPALQAILSVRGVVETVLTSDFLRRVTLFHQFSRALNSIRKQINTGMSAAAVVVGI